MLVNPRSVSWYFSINLSHMFLLAYSWNLDGKQVGLLKAAVKDLMGYKRMLMKKFDERNVAISEDMGELSFPRGIWPTGGIFQSKKQSSYASLWEARAPLKCPARSSIVTQKWNCLSNMAESEAEFLTGEEACLFQPGIRMPLVFLPHICHPIWVTLLCLKCPYNMDHIVVVNIFNFFLW